MSAEAIRCAGCDSSTYCACTNQQELYRQAGELIRRAAGGEANRDELENWLARDEQRVEEEQEWCRAARNLHASHGKGAIKALGRLINQWWFEFVVSGSDEEVHLTMRRHGERVRLEDVTAAREWLADRWLRPGAALWMGEPS